MLISSGFRSQINIQNNCSHCNDMQKLWRLELAQWTSTPSVEEAWPAQTGRHKDGAGSHGTIRRGTECGYQIVHDRNPKDSYRGQGMFWHYLNIAWILRAIDICRSRACTCYQDPIRHQKAAGRRQSCSRHSMWTPSRDLWVDVTTREDRVHSRASIAMHWK